ncbi:CopD family protein [Novosphingobium sp. 1949]|uniref:CopD family protein n=1 Tax=Novosphingobium organovorum TaxID=2930092 RepID=A0ABT0BDT1_9SPHN|nr:CopD family protein [Novosphingobium organovorum]MCJ2182956.1 CopD family protein [Novosphingobium organovorum]
MIDTGLVLARSACLASLMVTTGLVLHALIDGAAPLSAPRRKGVILTALAALPLSLWWALASVASMTATPLGALDLTTVRLVLGATPLGALLVVRGLALVLLAMLAWMRVGRTRAGGAWLALAALVALLSSAWSGHASALDGGPGLTLRASDMLHLAAAAVWLGALVTFCGQSWRACADRRAPPLDSLARFARTGTLVVTVLMLTGATNAVLIRGTTLLPLGAWGGLIATKIVLFGAMLLLAANNRWRLVPAVQRNAQGASSRLLRSLLLETLAAIAIVLVVGLAGTLDPS